MNPGKERSGANRNAQSYVIEDAEAVSWIFTDYKLLYSTVIVDALNILAACR
ncbi:MAG: hypothetical protein ACK4TA_00195 [Saprospiraceae bacterium]